MIPMIMMPTLQSRPQNIAIIGLRVLLRMGCWW